MLVFNFLIFSTFSIFKLFFLITFQFNIFPINIFKYFKKFLSSTLEANHFKFSIFSQCPTIHITFASINKIFTLQLFQIGVCRIRCTVPTCTEMNRCTQAYRFVFNFNRKLLLILSCDVAKALTKLRSTWTESWPRIRDFGLNLNLTWVNTGFLIACSVRSILKIEYRSHKTICRTFGHVHRVC